MTSHIGIPYNTFLTASQVYNLYYNRPNHLGKCRDDLLLDPWNPGFQGRSHQYSVCIDQYSMFDIWSSLDCFLWAQRTSMAYNLQEQHSCNFTANVSFFESQPTKQISISPWCIIAPFLALAANWRSTAISKMICSYFPVLCEEEREAVCGNIELSSKILPMELKRVFKIPKMVFRRHWQLIQLVTEGTWAGM